jgi:hypothetical protein
MKLYSTSLFVFDALSDSFLEGKYFLSHPFAGESSSENRQRRK